MGIIAIIICYTLITMIFAVFLVCIIIGFSGFELVDVIADNINNREKNKSKTKKEKERDKIRKEQEKILKKYYKEKDSLPIEVLRYEYSDYVEIVEQTLSKVCKSDQVETNDLYLIKVHKHLRKGNICKYNVSKRWCLYQAIIDFPVINEISSNEKIKNMIFLSFILNDD